MSLGPIHWMPIAGSKGRCLSIGHAGRCFTIWFEDWDIVLSYADRAKGAHWAWSLRETFVRESM